MEKNFKIELRDNEATNVVREYDEGEGKRHYLTKLVKEHVSGLQEGVEKMHMADILELARVVRDSAVEIVYSKKEEKS